MVRYFAGHVLDSEGYGEVNNRTDCTKGVRLDAEEEAALATEEAEELSTLDEEDTFVSEDVEHGDADTGEQAWRFWIVPGNPADGFEDDAMKMAAESWTGEWWKVGGGGTAWDSMAFDPDLDLLYVGTG